MNREALSAEDRTGLLERMAALTDVCDATIARQREIADRIMVPDVLKALEGVAARDESYSDAHAEIENRVTVSVGRLLAIKAEVRELLSVVETAL